MFNIFKRKTEKEKLENKYRIYLKEAFKLSKTNRSASDAKIVEANKLLELIEKLD
ncbi:MAG: Uncharacterised protein [Flavobacteriaceae bacterium]|nr:MAG: Uncharacterised protein [Flavobacteriaceae bacterium]|tara:strand:+ start:102 stop:266 length:165 start_codon:yes stop_codon:yes gene_type:complete